MITEARSPLGGESTLLLARGLMTAQALETNAHYASRQHVQKAHRGDAGMTAHEYDERAKSIVWTSRWLMCPESSVRP